MMADDDLNVLTLLEIERVMKDDDGDELVTPTKSLVDLDYGSHENERGGQAGPESSNHAVSGGNAMYNNNAVAMDGVGEGVGEERVNGMSDHSESPSPSKETRPTTKQRNKNGEGRMKKREKKGAEEEDDEVDDVEDDDHHEGDDDNEAGDRGEEDEEEGEIFEVNKILSHRNRGGRDEYLVSWKGFPSSENSWEPASNLNCPEIVARFTRQMQLTIQPHSANKKATKGTGEGRGRGRPPKAAPTSSSSARSGTRPIERLSTVNSSPLRRSSMPASVDDAETKKAVAGLGTRGGGRRATQRKKYNEERDGESGGERSDDESSSGSIETSWKKSGRRGASSSRRLRHSSPPAIEEKTAARKRKALSPFTPSKQASTNVLGTPSRNRQLTQAERSENRRNNLSWIHDESDSSDSDDSKKESKWKTEEMREEETRSSNATDKKRAKGEAEKGVIIKKRRRTEDEEKKKDESHELKTAKGKVKAVAEANGDRKTVGDLEDAHPSGGNHEHVDVVEVMGVAKKGNGRVFVGVQLENGKDAVISLADAKRDCPTQLIDYLLRNAHFLT